MPDPSLALQKAIFDALDGGVSPTNIGVPVLDRVSADQALPYVTIGEALVLPDKAECLDGSESTITVNAYSNAPGYPEVKGIAASIVAVLDENYDLTVEDHRVVVIELVNLAYRRDSDGLTSIADITFRVVTEPNTIT